MGEKGEGRVREGSERERRGKGERERKRRGKREGIVEVVTMAHVTVCTGRWRESRWSGVDEWSYVDEMRWIEMRMK